MTVPKLLREIEEKVLPPEVDAALKALPGRHPHTDSYMYPYWNGHDGIVIELNNIQVRKNAPKGAGTAFMDDLCRIADRYNFVISLTVASRGDGERGSVWKTTSSSERLRKWYRSLGFRSNAQTGRFDLRGHMHRVPVSSSPPEKPKRRRKPQVKRQWVQTPPPTSSTPQQ